MANTEIRMQQDGTLMASGDLVLANITLLLAQGEALFDGRDDVVFDLRDVTHTDSAGVALLLEWLERGRAVGTSVRYNNIPEALLRIARLSNIEALLPCID